MGLFGVVMVVFLIIRIYYPYLPVYSIAYMLGTCLLRTFLIGDEKEEYRTQLIRLAEERMREDQIAFNRISALLGDFLSLHVVEPETGHYREYTSNEGFRSFALPMEGTDFFEVAREEGRKLVYPEDLERYLSLFTKEAILDEIRKNGIFSISYRLVIQDKPTYVQFKAAMIEEDEGKRLIAGIIDVDAQVKQETEYNRRLAQAQAQARVDALTGVRNMHGYMETEEKLGRRIAEGEKPEFAIAVMDVNDLKKVNDEHGHQAGDEYLRKACRVICNTFKHSAVFRIGGDEFAVISMGEDYRNMDRLVCKESQFIISTHSPMLMTFPGAEIYQIQEDGIVSLPYNQTEHYKTTVRFMRNPESALEDILGEAEE